MSARDAVDLESRGLVLSWECTDAYCGQTNETCTAILDGVYVGHLDAVFFRGEPSIAHVVVQPFARRQGVATAMVRALQERAPEVEISWGFTTDEGEALRQSIPMREVILEDVVQLQAQLVRARHELAQLQAIDEQHERIDNPSDEQIEAYRSWLHSVSERWNGLHDEIWDLEQALEGRPDRKRIVMSLAEVQAQAESPPASRQRRAIPAHLDASLAPNGVAVKDNFAAWFRDSRAVDPANGAPLTLYHGSRVPRLERFSQAAVGTGVVSSGAGASRYGGAFFFTSSRDNALYYADLDEDHPEDDFIVEAHLCMRRPFVVHRSDAHAGASDSTGDLHQLREPPDAWNLSPVQAIAAAQQANMDRALAGDSDDESAYDGVIVRDVLDGSHHSDIYVVFSASQIKSVHNNGLFDPESTSLTDADADLLDSEAVQRDRQSEGMQTS